MNTFSFGNSLAKTYYNHPELLQKEGKQNEVETPRIKLLVLFEV